MNIGIDISPLKSDGRFLKHRIRGTGFYIENLKRSLLRYYPDNKYTFFARGERLPKDLDLIHYPYFEPFFLTLPFINRCKTVITVHDFTPFVFPSNFPAGLKGNLKWQIQKFLLKRADAIITDSKCSKKDILKYSGMKSNKVSVVYLAPEENFKKMDYKNASKLCKEKYRLPEKFALYVGDATWNKNLPRLIEAIKKTGVNFVMVGKALVQKTFDENNPWNKDLVNIHKLLINNDKVLCLGFIPTEDLVVIYNLATVFVMPSLYEGFGLPILEAMSCGCPVITTKEGSIPEVAGDAAYCVDAYNTQEIADGINKVYFDSKLQDKLSKIGLKRSEEFNWKKTATETMLVYKNVLLKQ